MSGSSLVACTSPVPLLVASSRAMASSEGGLRCNTCHEAKPASQLLPLAVHSWQGNLDCVCEQCSGLDKQDFLAKKKKAWKARSNNAEQLARVDGYRKAKAEVDKDPDETRKAYRGRVLARCI